jgi:hypothetical protein
MSEWDTQRDSALMGFDVNPSVGPPSLQAWLGRSINGRVGNLAS